MVESQEDLTAQPLIKARRPGLSRELILFISAMFALSLGYSMIDSTLNNFLNERFALTPFERSFLEFPRELPGFLVVFVSALLWFLCSRRLGLVSVLLVLAGTLLVGFASPTYALVVLSLFVYSMGQHLFMPVSSTIGMELAEPGRAGRRLGQINSVRNLATIVGSFVIFTGFHFLGFNFQHSFALAAVFFAIAAFLMSRMAPEKAQGGKGFLTLRREYSLYYLLSVLFGSRKQLFLTFAPWVIVTVFNQPTQTLATLLFIGGVIGVLFQPILGLAVDRLGERFVLAAEAALLVLVCFGYGFARQLFPEGIAFLVTCGLYLADQMLLSVNMARSTYMKKIALRPEDVQPALTASVTIDHLFSIIIALIGGAIWNAFGYQYVFLLGVFIALLNLAAAMFVRVEKVKV